MVEFNIWVLGVIVAGLFILFLFDMSDYRKRKKALKSNPTIKE